MNSDFDEIDQILKRHFENITPEEFKSNLKAACPSLFERPTEVIHEKKESIYSTEDFLSGKGDDAKYQEIDRILTEHFEKITPEEFKRNLKIACPSWINTPSIPAKTRRTLLRKRAGRAKIPVELKVTFRERTRSFK
jgi:hypothetical protein